SVGGRGDLDTFPTRRSSDLRLLGWGVTEPDGGGSLPVMVQELDIDPPAILPADRCAAGGITAGELCINNVNGTDGPCFGDSGGRSEEHTSELQSRSDLVCRL